MKKKKQTTIEEEIKLKKQIGKNVQAIRHQLRHSANTVAKKLHMTRVGLTQIELGKNHINGVTLWKLACLFKCDVDDFFPKVQHKHALTKADISTIAQVNEEAAKWADKIFND